MSGPATARSDLALRLLTAACWVPLLLGSLFLAPHWVFPALAASVCGLGALELSAMTMPRHTLARAFGLLTTLAVFAAIGGGASGLAFTITLVALVCCSMVVSLAQIEPIAEAGARMAWSIAGPLYIGGLFGVIAHLFQQPHGGEWVVLAMLFGFWSDTGGYFAGRAYGKHKMYEAVSPKKTWEGAVGGLLGALIGGLIAHFWFLPSLSLPHAIGLSLGAAAAGQAGDLCESLIKRSLGVKDSGTILPGHGGILDRVDALLFSAAAVWSYVMLFGG